MTWLVCLQTPSPIYRGLKHTLMVLVVNFFCVNKIGISVAMYDLLHNVETSFHLHEPTASGNLL